MMRCKHVIYTIFSLLIQSFISVSNPTNLSTESLQSETCTTTGTKVDCSNKNLTTIPFEQISPEVEWLILSNNEINEITETDLKQFKNLNTLDISQNKLEKIHIQNLPSTLKSLYANDNKITTLVIETRINCTDVDTHCGLEYLYVINNQFSNFFWEIVAQSAFTKLKVADFSWNKIVNLFGQVGNDYYGVMDLTSLNLKGNLIKDIHRDGRFHGGFDIMPELRDINLDTNLITEIQTNMFINTYLQTLNLDNNPIETFTGVNTTTLRTLYLRNENLKSFDLDSFMKMIYKNDLPWFNLYLGSPELAIINEGNTTVPWRAQVNLQQAFEIDVTKLLARFPIATTAIFKNVTITHFTVDFQDALEVLYLENLALQDWLSEGIDETLFIPRGLISLVINKCTGFSEFPDGLFPEMTKLAEMDVSDLNLKNLNIENDRVDIIVANGNNLKQASVSSQYLAVLSVAGSSLTEVPISADNGYLKYLDMSDNELTSFDASVLNGYGISLTYLDISGNPFECSCDSIPVDHIEFITGGEDISEDLMEAYNYECVLVDFEMGEKPMMKVLDIDWEVYCPAVTTPGVTTPDVTTPKVTSSIVTSANVTSSIVTSETSSDVTTTETIPETTQPSDSYRSTMSFLGVTFIIISLFI